MRPTSGWVSKDHAAVVADTGRYSGDQCVSKSPDPYVFDLKIAPNGRHPSFSGWRVPKLAKEQCEIGIVCAIYCSTAFATAARATPRRR